jgi:hypothetical protein
MWIVLETGVDSLAFEGSDQLWPRFSARLSCDCGFGALSSAGFGLSE